MKGRSRDGDEMIKSCEMLTLTNQNDEVSQRIKFLLQLTLVDFVSISTHSTFILEIDCFTVQFLINNRPLLNCYQLKGLLTDFNWRPNLIFFSK